MTKNQLHDWIAELDSMTPDDRMKDMRIFMPPLVVERLDEMYENLAEEAEADDYLLHDMISGALLDVEDHAGFSDWTERTKFYQFQIACGLYVEMDDYELKNTLVHGRSKKAWDLKLGGKYYSSSAGDSLAMLTGGLKFSAWKGGMS